MNLAQGIGKTTTLIRLGIDFVILHLSMFLAITVAAVFYQHLDPGLNAAALLQELGLYYKAFACIASPLFLALLYALGVYERRTIALALLQRVRHLAQAIILAMLVLLAANYFAFRDHILSRGVAVLFYAFVMTLFFASRWMEACLRPRFEIVERFGIHRRPVDAPVLVIGGAGYIGSMLCRKLLADGERVRVLDSLVYSDSAIRDLLGHPRFELVTGDCRHIQTAIQAANGVKSIVDLAAIVGDPACDQDQKNAIEINYAATRMLIEVAKGQHIDRLVFASSCSVYGATTELMNEESATVPISLYGKTKIDSEKVLLEARGSDFHPVVLRLATVFGNGYRPRFDLLVNLLVARAAQEKLITIYNEHQWRPFIHVWDAARGFAAAVNAPAQKVSGEVFNLGDNRMNFTLREVAAEVCRTFPETEVRYISNTDKRTYRVDFKKAERSLGFRCTVSLREGISELRRALEDGSVKDYNDLRYNNQKYLSQFGQLSMTRDVDQRIVDAFIDHEPLVSGRQS
jgi:nucleoside-diphosphate-sugar epimerase